MRINIYAHLIIIEILDEIYARAQTWSSVEAGEIESLVIGLRTAGSISTH